MKNSNCIHCSNLLCLHNPFQAGGQPWITSKLENGKSSIRSSSSMTMYRIRDFIWRSELIKRTCHECHQLFTELDWEKDNWDVFYRDLDWDNFAKKASRGWLAIEFDLGHNNCPKKNKNA